MIIFATDFNAKLSNDRDYCPEELSPHGLGDRNENGAVLIEVASTNNLLIGGTQLRHKNIHMCAWTSPDGKTRNQIDQFLIKRKWRSNLQALKTLREADLAQTKVSPAEPEVRRKFFLSLHNRFEALRNLGEGEGDVHTIWSDTSSTFNDVVKDNIQSPRRHILQDEPNEVIPAIDKLIQMFLSDSGDIFEEINLDGEDINTFSDNGFSPLNVQPNRDLSSWRVSIPRIIRRSSESRRNYFVYVIDVQRVDLKYEDALDNFRWTVEREYSEFYNLEDQLTKFHGILHDVRLPPKKIFGFRNHEFLESKRPVSFFLLFLLFFSPLFYYLPVFVLSF
ncbi:hypothetical protein QYM36_017587 [Artemia franciscana]|uniref:PX domain-containing protein n=1 Tax=Artemia franciscana TaxID=6661 RepID=A0AA88L1G8_ARTSF|nr:hypothetical protein QYM36_017587 [Artemia franciscana]